VTPSGSPWPARRQGHRGPAAKGSGGRATFATTWWGRAWIDALEQRARLDPNRLPRGRSYARSGAVGDLVVSAGQVQASVQGSRRTPYTVRVRVRQLTDAEWDRLFDAVALQVGRTAALLDGELPPEVAADVRAAGLDLLPGAGEVGPQCSCPDSADPCKHAAAVCYLVAVELDRDPFALLLLRGRSRGEVLSGLRRRRRSHAVAELPAAAPAPDEGVPARAAYAAATRPPLPVVPLPPTRPGRPAALPVEPPPGSPIARRRLVELAADAATRAWELASGVSDGGLSLDEESDLARRAAGVLGTAGLAQLATTAGLSSRELTRWALAYRQGSSGGVAALRDTWRPDPSVLAEGRAAVEAAGFVVHARANRVSGGGLQLRLGRDGLWYRFAQRFGEWDLDAPPESDPAALVSRLTGSG
jgi:uncharacterized Zn finger protein